MLKTKKKKRKSKLTNKTLAKKSAWAAFSIYIRTRDKFVCFTCGKHGDVHNMQAGHFISRTYTSILFDETNVNAQCSVCNVLKSGCWDVYYEKMKLKYGQSVIDFLQNKKNDTCQLTIQDYLALEAKYKDKIKTL